MTSTTRTTPGTGPDAPTDDYTKAVALVKVAQRDYAAGVKAVENSTVSGAMATHAAFTAGLVGDEGSLYPKVQDYANLFTREVDGEPKPMSRVTVTLWRRLGKCLALGIEAYSREWKRLVQNANAKAVSSVIDADNATAAKVAKAVNSLYGRDGKPKPKPESDKDASKDKDETGVGETGTTAATAPVSVPAMLDLLDVLALRLSTGRMLTPDEADRLTVAVEVLGTCKRGASEDEALAS